jgi:hypothetical protein
LVELCSTKIGFNASQTGSTFFCRKLLMDLAFQRRKNGGCLLLQFLKYFRQKNWLKKAFLVKKY